MLEGDEVVAGLQLALSSSLRFRIAAIPASDTLTHFGSGAVSGTYMSCQFHHW
jgi:hypothetical protein